MRAPLLKGRVGAAEVPVQPERIERSGLQLFDALTFGSCVYEVVLRVGGHVVEGALVVDDQNAHVVVSSFRERTLSCGTPARRTLHERSKAFMHVLALSST
jgi:hypothetical protein